MNACLNIRTLAIDREEPFGGGGEYLAKRGKYNLEGLRPAGLRVSYVGNRLCAAGEIVIGRHL